MRRLLSLATFVLVLSLIPVSAQMRGGGHGGFSGGHGGFSGRGSFGGGHFGGGHMGAGHGFVGAPGRSFSGSRFQSRGFNRGGSFHQPFLHDGFHRGHFRGDHFRDHRFHRFGFNNFGFRNCLGWNCGAGWGWPWWSSFDPYWWWDSGSSYDEDRERDLSEARAMNEQSLEEQRMRHEQDQDLYAQGDPPAQSRQPQAPPVPTPATVLVFRDQHTQEVQNYAIVGTTLWNFAPQHTQKIPLSDLDVDATVKVNDQRGVEFRMPIAGEGQ